MNTDFVRVNDDVSSLTQTLDIGGGRVRRTGLKYQCWCQHEGYVVREALRQGHQRGGQLFNGPQNSSQ